MRGYKSRDSLKFLTRDCDPGVVRDFVIDFVSLESDTIRGNLAELRNDIKRGKGRLAAMFSFFNKSGKRTKKGV